jgi:hypothetical protein
MYSKKEEYGTLLTLIFSFFSSKYIISLYIENATLFAITLFLSIGIFGATIIIFMEKLKSNQIESETKTNPALLKLLNMPIFQENQGIQEIKSLCTRLKNISDEDSRVEDRQGMLEILNIGNNIENEEDPEVFNEIYNDIKDTMEVYEPHSQNILEDFYSYYTNEEKSNQLKIRALAQAHKNWDKIYNKIKTHGAFTNLNLSERDMKIMLENFVIVMCNDMGIVDCDLQVIFDDEECFSVADSTIERLIEFI